MRTYRKLAWGAALTLFCAGAIAQPAIVTGGVSGQDIQKIDVRGFGLGATPEEFRQQLAENGFQAGNTSPNQVANGLYVGAVRATIDGLSNSDHVRSIVAWRCNGGPCPNRLNYSTYNRNETVGAVFLGPGNENRAWGIRVVLSYASGEAPSQANVLQALTEKYGAPSLDSMRTSGYAGNRSVYWFWNSQGNLLPYGQYHECKDAIHDAGSRMMMSGRADASLTNLATMRVPALKGLDRAQCAYGVHAYIGAPQNGISEVVTVDAVALKAANDGSRATSALVTAEVKAAAQNERAAADKRKPTF